MSEKKWFEPDVESRPYPKNVDGPFFVEDECCLACDIPKWKAPEMFEYDDDTLHCYVSRQPESKNDFAKMIEATISADLECIKYQGDDPEIIDKLENWEKYTEEARNKRKFRRYFVVVFVFLGLVQLLLSLSDVRSWNSPYEFEFHGSVLFGFPFGVYRYGYGSEFYLLGLILNIALLVIISLFAARCLRRI